MAKTIYPFKRKPIWCNLLTSTVGILLLFSSSFAWGHSFQGLIYGTITLKDGGTKTGIIQWQNRQLFWEDIFVSIRKDNPSLTFLKSSEIKKLSDDEKKEKIEWGFMQIWENKYPSRTNRFSCRFGDIATITTKEGKKAELRLKNGSSIAVEGSDKFRDIGSNLHLADPSGKWQRIGWSKVSKIEFTATPSHALSTAVRPLFGTVKSKYGTLTGYIKWDQDETMTSTKLDGKDQEKTHKIPFWQINHILKKDDNSSEVTLRSGSKLLLWGTDDVGSSNHGLTIFSRNMGAIKVKWKDFIELELSHKAYTSQLYGYRDFRPSTKLMATVTTLTGSRYQGRIVYDLDEQWNSDILEGYKNGLNYLIPFGNIRTVERKNEKQSLISLRNGAKVLLGGQNDVNDKNWGLLIWNDQEKPKYVPWNQVKTVQFK
ncbi:hypothetical protein CLV98_10590 [Dyadobacter jejuensis]|uniref:Uncharacterized protein n=1 Tax=Dyadobacter jejuensis TaxID=1082580 RepID=A0A316AM92_9BACT|nr:hypothetical protein [Dyadobacter jejuensis]PWJ57910.1 hypothetical protein CLV98_10590 [Dyadobacter jejuensis]